MRKKTIQDILPLVEKPSHYLGSEINSIKKDHSNITLKIALVFPDRYDIGTSHFGLQILYHILNKNKDIVVERFFSPARDMEALLRQNALPITSLETGTPLKSFDIIGFSLLYELNYTNILTILDLADIPFFSNERDSNSPLIIAGGPCTCNPEPVADFFDAMVIGDGEETMLNITHTWLKWKKEGKAHKGALLKEMSEITSVYVPSFFEATYNSDGFQTLTPKHHNQETIKRAIASTLLYDDFPDAPIIPFGRPVHDRLRIEVARGCTRGCRFCQAGIIYRPVRERDCRDILSLAEKAIKTTGYEDISLLSLSTGDYSGIAGLLEQFMNTFDNQCISVSLPSLRADTLTPELMEKIKRVRKTGFTIAPEAGSQRLRNSINKNITEEDILKTVDNAFGLGWHVIKLYFMDGLPGETEDDLSELVALVKKIRARARKTKGKKKIINVSISTFVPKAHTPFQWAPQINTEEAKQKLFWIKGQLKYADVKIKWQYPEMSFLEGVFARGDRRLSKLLVKAYSYGCRFDGWVDHFNADVWQKAFSETGLDTMFFTTRKRSFEEPLPWDHIDTGVTKAFLAEEWQKSIDGALTADCRHEDCNACGVCDFKSVQPVINRSVLCGRNRRENHRIQSNTLKTLKILYSKKERAKYFSHLELVNIFFRAISRAAIPVAYSEGFHPKQKISFNDPLPVGIESLEEILYVTVSGHVKTDDVIKQLNRQLPEGIRVLDCYLISKKKEKPSKTVKYEIAVSDAYLDKNSLDAFNESADFIITKRNYKGKEKTVNLKDYVVTIDLLDSNRLQMILKTESGAMLRPVDILTAVFNVEEEQMKQAKVVKLRGSLDL